MKKEKKREIKKKKKENITVDRNKRTKNTLFRAQLAWAGRLFDVAF